MAYYSTFVTRKSVENNKNPFLGLGLVGISLYYGVRCYYIEDSMNSMLILLFFLSLLMAWRCLTIYRTFKSSEDGAIEVELGGGCWVWLLVFFNTLKLVSEALFKIYGSQFLFQNFNTDQRIKNVLTFMLNANNISKSSLTGIIALNALEISFLLILKKIQNSLRIRVLDEEIFQIMQFYKKILEGLRVLLFCFLVLESVMGNFIYILIIYFLLRQQMVAANRNISVKNHIYFGRMRYLTICIFFFRDIFIVVGRVFLATDFTILFTAISESKFFRQTLFFFGCHFYIYLKHLRQEVGRVADYKAPTGVVSTQNFEQSFFKRKFLNNIVHVMKIQTFAQEENFSGVSIKLVQQYFDSDPLIKSHIQELKRNKSELNYRMLTQVVKKIAKMIVKTIAKNFDLIFKGLTYLSLVMVAARNYDLHTFEVYDVSMIMWGFISFIIRSDQWRILKNYTINVVFPCFVLGMVFTKFYESFLNLSIIGSVIGERTSSSGMTIDTYFRHHMIAFSPLLVYTIVQTLKENPNVQKLSIFKTLFEDKIIPGVQKKSDYLQSAIRLLMAGTIKFSRFIALSFGIVSSLVTVNIPNTILLLSTLFFFWTNQYDRTLWKVYIYYIIFFMAILQLNQTLPNDIESFNYEVLSILGFSKQGVIYRTQFAFSFVTCMFASICYKYKESVSSGEIEAFEEEDLNQLQQSKIYARLEQWMSALLKFFIANMVWFFHISILVGMSYEVGDVFSLALYLVDSLIFVLHIYIKWTSSAADRNRRMLLSWYPSLVLVIILICFRYAAFYFRYLTVRKLAVGFFINIGMLNSGTTQDQFFSNSSNFSKLCLKHNSSQQVERLYTEFYLELLYLASSCLTLRTLQQNLERDSPPESPAAKHEDPSVSEEIASLIEPIIDRGDDKAILENNIGASGPIYNLKVEDESPEPKVTNNEDDKDSKGSSVDSEERRDQDEEALEAKEVMAVSKAPPGIDRPAFIMFFSFFILFRTLSFTFMISIFESQVDFLNFLFIGAEVVFFNMLFWSLTSTQNFFAAEKFITYYLDYFKRSFVDKITFQNQLAGISGVLNPNLDDRSQSRKTFDAEDDAEDDHLSQEDISIRENIVRDVEQSRYYVDQLFIRVKTEVTNLSTKFCFLRVFIITIRGYFILAEFLSGFYKASKNPDELIAKNRQTMLQNTMFMALILTELLFVKQYLLLIGETDTVEEGTKILSQFVEMIITKLEYYTQYSKSKVRVALMEAKFNTEGGEESDGLINTQMSMAERSATKQAPKKPKAYMLRKKDTVDEKAKLEEKRQMELREAWVAEKNSIFVNISQIYQKYLDLCNEVSKNIKKTFIESLDEYCFEDPEAKFLRLNYLAEPVIDNGAKLQFASGPGTSKLLKFLFIHRNTYKFKFCTLLVGGMYAIRRVLLIPLLYTSASESNLMSLPLLLTAVVYSLRGSRSITSDLKLFLPIFSVMFIIMFFSSIILNNTSQYGNISQGQAELEHYAKASWGLSRESLVVMSLLFCCIGVSFIFLHCLVYIIADYMFITRKNSKHMYFYFVHERGRQILAIDFLEWKKSVFSKMHFLLTLIYDHVLEYYLVFMYLLAVLNPNIYNSVLLVVVVFMIASQMIPFLKKYSIVNLTSDQIKNFTYFFNLIFYFLMVNYTCASIFRNTKTVRQLEFWRNLIDQTLVAFLLVLVLNFSISDFMNSEDFREEKDMLNKRAEIKVKFGALFEAYKQNENAIFERCKLISKMKELDSIEKLYWQNLESLKKIKFDYNYFDKDLRNLMKTRESELKDRYMGGWANIRTGLAESIYRFCFDKTSSSFFEDFLYLLLQVFSQNQFLLKGGILNIEDYYGGDFTKYETVYSEIQNFYHGLRNKEAIPTNTYKTKLNEIRKQHIKRLKLWEGTGAHQFNHSNTVNPKKSSEMLDRSNSDEPKEKQDLRSAGIVLANYLMADRRHEEKIKDDTDVLLCDFGRYRVRFYNLSNSMMHKTQGFQVFRFGLLAKMVLQLIVTRLEYVVGFFIITLQIYKGGVENFIIIGIIFFCILVETHLGHSRWWQVLFYLYLLKCTVAYSIQATASTTSTGPSTITKELTIPQSVFYIFVGSPAYVYDALILISIFVLILVLKMRGFSDRHLVEFEDPGTCVARLVINSRVDYLFMSKLRTEIETFGEKLRYLEKHILKRNRNHAIIRSFGFIKDKIEMHIQSVRFERAFFSSFIELIRQGKNDLYEASYENVTNFYWRNFSFYTKKPGINRSTVAFTFFVIALVYITYVTPTLQENTFSFFTSISQNELMSSNTIIIFIFTVFGVVDGIVSRRFSIDKTGLERKPMIFDQFEKMNLTYQQESLFIKPHEKFRKAYRKICAIFNLRKIASAKRDPVEENPMKTKYYYILCFWLVVHALVYLHLIAISNPDQNKTTFQAISSFLSSDNLLTNFSWTKIRVFYFLCILYVYVVVSQIHYGQVIFQSFVSTLDLKGQASHQLSDLVPFYREIGVLMDYIANKSSLQLRHKLTFNDILYSIRTAKIEEITRKETSFGKHPGVWTKLFVGLLWTVLTLIIVFGPLLPFTSMFNANEPVYIKDASMQVNFADSTGKEIGRLFETQTNVQNHEAAYVSPYFETFMQKKENNKITYLPQTFEVLTMSKNSETRSTLEDRFFYELSLNDTSRVFKIISEGSLVFRLMVILKDNMNYSVVVVKKFSSSGDKEAEELTSLLTTKCDSVNIKRTIQISQISLIYQIDKSGESGKMQRPAIDPLFGPTYMWSKLNINCVCDANKRKIFSLFNEELDNDKIQFLIITYETQGSQDVISRLVGFQIEVILLYIIAFRYLGVSLIRSFFFDKHSLTWYTTLPDPDKLLCLLDAIRYAQFEEDHLREELLFYMLTDIMRNPESLKDISGSVNEKQWEIYLEEKRNTLR